MQDKEGTNVLGSHEIKVMQSCMNYCLGTTSTSARMKGRVEETSGELEVRTGWPPVRGHGYSMK